MQWLSRTLAILIFMVVPGVVGSLLDRQLRTAFLTPVGFGIGIALATAALLILANKLVPPGRGRPLPLDDDVEDDLGPEDGSEEGNRAGSPRP